MNRAAIIVLALGAGIGAALVLSVLGGDDTGDAPTSEPAAEPSEPSERQVGTAAPREHRERPELELPEPVEDAGVRTYVTDGGGIVRDYRERPRGPLTRPLASPAREKRDPITRATLGRMRLALRPGIKRCARDHADTYAADAVLQVVVHADIADGVATASGLEMQGTAGDAVESCVRALVTSLRVDVPGAPDRSDYTMTFPFDLGPLRE